jgi:hypothetical protein
LVLCGFYREFAGAIGFPPSSNAKVRFGLVRTFQKCNLAPSFGQGSRARVQR